MKFAVLVKPGSKKGDLVEATGERLTVFLRARAVDGAANQALIRVLAKHFHVAKSQIAIANGQKSRKKLVEVEK